VVSLVARGSDSGLVTRAAFKAVRLPADAGSGRFDSYPLPPLPWAFRDFAAPVEARARRCS